MLIMAVIIYVTVLVASGVEAWLFWKMHEEEKVYNRNAFVEKVPFVVRASYSLFVFIAGGFMLPVPFVVEEITSEGIWFGAIFTAIWFFVAIVLFFKMSVKITVNGNNATIKKPFRKEISFSFYDVVRIICDHTFARNGKAGFNYIIHIYTKEGLLITMNYKFVDCDHLLRKLKGYPHIMREDKY